LNAYRFSIAWPRIIPDGTGPVNQRGLDFYDRLVDLLLAHNIVPMATLYHWDLPMPLYQLVGWLRRETSQAFAEYAGIVARRLGDRVSWWLTLNEPWCSAYLGYGNGVHAPGGQNLEATVTAGHHLMLAHGLAIPRLRAAVTAPGAKIGIALNLYPVHAADDRPETQAAVRWMDGFKNRWFLDPLFRGTYPDDLFAGWQVAPPTVAVDDMELISQPIDFLGVNYYERTIVRLNGQAIEEVRLPENTNLTTMGWEVYPAGLTETLRRVHQDYHPALMVVTENGAAYADAWDHLANVVADPERATFLSAHITALQQAMAEGIPIQGYLAWSFLDNFEWSEGYRYRFGLVYVDFATQRRIVKQSGRWFADFIRSARA
jgi:beta-glucosidase